MSTPAAQATPPTADKAQTKPKPRSSSGRAFYLAVYNFVSAILWSVVLGRTALTLVLRGYMFVPVVVDNFVRITQTLAILEVVHSALGIVRAPIFTTAMQVASRLLLVWLVVFPFPQATLTSPFYSSMLLAWSLTEVIRYSYFSITLARGPDHPLPNWFTILRYSTFLVLYPVGISSEVRLVYLAASTPDAAPALHPLYAYALYAVLAVYIPGSYILYTHMLAQRRKVLRRLREEGKKEQ